MHYTDNDIQVSGCTECDITANASVNRLKYASKPDGVENVMSEMDEPRDVDDAHY